LSLVFVGFQVVKAVADIEFSSTVHVIKYIFGSDELRWIGPYPGSDSLGKGRLGFLHLSPCLTGHSGDKKKKRQTKTRGKK
jgi:hypothetical protein